MIKGHELLKKTFKFQLASVLNTHRSYAYTSIGPTYRPAVRGLYNPSSFLQVELARCMVRHIKRIFGKRVG